MAGLSLEIVGAFVLAAEAIGVERLDSWAANFSRARAEMAGTQPRRGSTFLDPNRFIAGLASAGGVAFGYWLSFRVPPWPSDIAAKAAAIVGGGLAGGVFGVVLYQGALATLRIGVHALRRLEARVRFRAVGVLGFGLLFVGFVLQLIGTLIDGLRVVAP
jgi:hypothetical protein